MIAWIKKWCSFSRFSVFLFRKDSFMFKLEKSNGKFNDPTNNINEKRNFDEKFYRNISCFLQSNELFSNGSIETYLGSQTNWIRFFLLVRLCSNGAIEHKKVNFWVTPQNLTNIFCWAYEIDFVLESCKNFRIFGNLSTKWWLSIHSWKNGRNSGLKCILRNATRWLNNLTCKWYSFYVSKWCRKLCFIFYFKKIDRTWWYLLFWKIAQPTIYRWSTTKQDLLFLCFESSIGLIPFFGSCIWNQHEKVSPFEFYSVVWLNSFHLAPLCILSKH